MGKKAVAKQPPLPPDAAATTGSSRRDKVTQAQFARLAARVPLLQSNAGARAQLTQIVFGGLTEIRATEDRSAELCEGSLTTEGCNLCSWKQKGFCEACGTDFSKTQSERRAAGLARECSLGLC